MIRLSRQRAGFSLIELSILLVIVSLTAATLLETYRMYSIRKAANDTSNHEKAIVTQLVKYYLNFGHLPVPEDPAAAVGTPTGGKEVPAATAAGLAINACSGSMCKKAGARDTLADADFTADPVLFGTIPYAAIGMNSSDALDGWGNKYTYVVSYYLTKKATYNSLYGAINIKQMDRTTGLITASLQLQDTDSNPGTPDVAVGSSYLYVLLSHGPDGKGAWSYYGKRNKPCTGTNRDVENCNDDAVFLNPGNGTANTNLISLAKSTAAQKAEYFDDPKIDFKIEIAADLWAAQTGAIRNLTDKSALPVAIGYKTVTGGAGLDVNGAARANNFWTNGVQNTDATTTFPPSIFGGGPGLGLDCNGGVMYGIEGGKALCTLTLQTSAKVTGCTGLHYMTGLDSGGNAICSP